MQRWTIDLVDLGDNILVTPWHPVRIHEGKWFLPKDAGEVTTQRCELVYNLVLESEEPDTNDVYFRIGNYDALSLGHGGRKRYSDHSYLGTAQVVDDLREKDGWKEGKILLGYDTFDRDRSGNIVKLIQRNIPSTEITFDLDYISVFDDKDECTDIVDFMGNVEENLSLLQHNKVSEQQVKDWKASVALTTIAMATIGDKQKMKDVIMDILAIKDRNSPEFNSQEKKINDALKVLERSGDLVVTSEHFLSIIQEWKPKKDMMALFFRWAKKLPQNFNNDSIALVGTIVEQCKCTSLQLLKNRFTFKLVNKTKKRKCGPYGIKISLVQRHDSKRKRDDTYNNIAGLPVTFSFLEKDALNSKASFVKLGMRESNDCVQQFQVEEGIQLVGIAQQQIHKGISFYRRVITELYHKSLAFYVVKFIYGEVYQDLAEDTKHLEFSYNMFYKMRNRYDFLQVFTNMFFLIQDFHNITNFKDQLIQLRKFNSLGAFSEYFFNRSFLLEDKKEYIVQLFCELQSQRQLLFSSIRGDKELKWKYLQASVFIPWLDRRACRSLKKSVMFTLNSSPLDTSCTTGRKTTVSSNSTSYRLSDGVGRTRQQQLTSIEGLSTFQDLLSSQSDVGDINSSCKDNNSTDNNTDSDVDQTTTSKILEEIKLLADNADFSKQLSIISQEMMNKVISSRLVIITDQLQMLSKLSNIEIYQAGGLVNFYHYQETSNPSTFPKNVNLRSYNYIPATEPQYLDY